MFFGGVTAYIRLNILVKLCIIDSHDQGKWIHNSQIVPKRG